MSIDEPNKEDKYSMYIVTNIGGGYNYTPSVFFNKEEAYNWFYRLSFNTLARKYPEVAESIYHNHLKDKYGELLDSDKLSTADRKMMLELSLDLIDSDIDKSSIRIGDHNEGGNIIQIFEYYEINLPLEN